MDKPTYILYREHVQAALYKGIYPPITLTAWHVAPPRQLIYNQLVAHIALILNFFVYLRLICKENHFYTFCSSERDSKTKFIHSVQKNGTASPKSSKMLKRIGGNNLWAIILFKRILYQENFIKRFPKESFILPVVIKYFFLFSYFVIQLLTKRRRRETWITPNKHSAIRGYAHNSKNSDRSPISPYGGDWGKRKELKMENGELKMKKNNSQLINILLLRCSVGKIRFKSLNH